MRKPLNNLLSQVGIKTHNMHPVPQQLCVDTRRRYLCIHAKKKKKTSILQSEQVRNSTRYIQYAGTTS